jgi:CRP-like cAMP-binding protein
MPWYGKRNLLRLLSGTGDEGDIRAVHGYLSHEDLRVQSEALTCIQRLSEKKRKQELLDALPRISEKLKYLVVRALASVVDEEVVGVLVELLKDERYFSEDIKTILLVSICQTLGRSGSPYAQKALQSFTGKGDTPPRGMAEQVWRAARRGVEVIEASLREQKFKNIKLDQRTLEAGRPVPSGSEGAAREYLPITNLAVELEIYELLSHNRLTAAKSLLLALISTMSYLQKFDQAEALCRRLVEIDALALDDIVHATEIVQEQKTLSVEQEQGMRWTDVYDFLTTEEFNCLYSVMEHVTYSPDENIEVHGDHQQLLFFINKGRAKLFYQDRRGNEILLKTVGTGEILGADSFFKASAWTVNAASIGTVDAFVLRRECLTRCKNSCPELEAKLEAFCQQLGEHESTKVMAINRRAQSRYPLSSPLLMAMLDDDGRVTGTALKGQTVDISVGGLSFMIRIKNIRHLLGRRVHISLPDGLPAWSLTGGVDGTVMAIYMQGTLKEGAAVHIQFDKPVPEAELAGMVSEV